MMVHILCTTLQKTQRVLMSHIYHHFMDFIYLDKQDMTDQSFSRYPSGFVLRKDCVMACKSHS